MSNPSKRTTRELAGKCIAHSLSVECVLEFGAHECVAISRVTKNGKVDLKHGHVEEQRNDDEANGTSKEMSVRKLVSFKKASGNNVHLIHSVGLTLASPKSVHSCLIVENPTVAIVNKPTHLQETTAPSARPVSVRYVHHTRENGPVAITSDARVPCACGAFVTGLRSSLQNMTQKRVLRPVKKRSGLSRRMCLLWVMRPFSKRTRMLPRSEVLAPHPSSRRVRWVMGTSATPSRAGIVRIMTYGTLGGYMAPISLNSNEPSKPPIKEARVRRSLASGGWTST